MTRQLWLCMDAGTFRDINASKNYFLLLMSLNDNCQNHFNQITFIGILNT